MVTNKEISDKRRGRFFAYAPLVLWAVLILILGSGAGSTAQTSRFIKPLIEFFFPDAAPDTFLLVHAFIRKTAHFVEYAILAALAARAFSGFSTGWPRRNSILSSAAVVVGVASLDEFNQSFLISRTGSGWDVLLDMAGGAAVLATYYLIRNRRSREMG